MTESLVRVEAPTIARESLTDYSGDSVTLREAIEDKYSKVFPQFIPQLPVSLNSGDYHFLQVQNPDRALKYATRNAEILNQHLQGFGPMQTRVNELSFLTLDPKEYVGRTGNFAVAINSAPYTINSSLFIPIHRLGKEATFEYCQGLAKMEPGILDEIRELTAEGVFSVFLNNVVNSQKMMHFCGIGNEQLTESGEKVMLPVAEALSRKGDRGYDIDGINLYYPGDDKRSVRLNSMVYEDPFASLRTIRRLEDVGIKSDLLVSQGKICVVPYIDDVNPVTILPDGTPWLPSGERLGFILKTPNFNVADDPKENDKYIKGLIDAFNSKTFTNEQIRRIIYFTSHSKYLMKIGNYS